MKGPTYNLYVLLITGTRGYSRNPDVEKFVRSRVYKLKGRRSYVFVLHGDCAGVDREAGKTAVSLGVHELKVPALWTNGMGAGNNRNTALAMLARCFSLAGANVEVHAFPGKKSKGTWDMVEKAKVAGLHTEVHE